jgi:hypothetical protein
MTELFDSRSERRVFSTVRTRWSRFLDVYPQIPVRKALGFDNVMSLPIRDSAREYLLKTEFDFVVCDRSGSVILAIEFDGLGHGFSRDGKYIQIEETEDQHRRLKLDAKISACEMCDLPIVVVSYPETEPSFDPDSPVTVLDTVIGEVLAGRKRQELVNSGLDELGEMLATDPARDTAYSYLAEIEVMAEQENPIRRRIAQMQMELPVSFGQQIHPLHDKPGYIGARQSILGGIELAGQSCRRQELLTYDAYVRTVNCSGCSAFDLANLLAEYGLTRKALRTVGRSREAWQKLRNETPFIEI